jgi:uridine kinase
MKDEKRPEGVFPSQPRQTVQARFPNGVTYEAPAGTRLKEFVDAADTGEVPIMAALVNGKLRELTHPMLHDADVQPIAMDASDGMRIFQRSLTFVLIVAARELFPDASITIDHSIPLGGYFCEVANRPLFTEEELQQIHARMREIVEADEPITRREVGIEEAIQIFTAWGCEDKVRLLQNTHPRTSVTIYSLRGVQDYFYGYMAPSAGCLRTFTLRPATDGFLLVFPLRTTPTLLPEYQRVPKLTAVFREHLEWMEVMGTEDVATLNMAVESGRIREVILVAEALQERRLAEIAGRIAAKPRTTRLVLIAGPSSSGKTTSSKRLAVHLLARGVRPLAIGLDDYFVNRDETPHDEHGDYDFEALEAVDVRLFNRQLMALCEGQEVTLPHYDFQTGVRTSGRRLSISDEHVIIVEGIHGLNPRLVPDFPPESVFRLYISALTQLNVDRHNRVPTTDTRLIRRIVRDARFRGYSALTTIERWESVRRGERRHIFPYQDNADEMFNSALLYELAVLKPRVEPLLRQITPDETLAYVEANRLLAFLSWLLPCDADLVPDNSLLREFIGGSSLAQFNY